MKSFLVIVMLLLATTIPITAFGANDGGGTNTSTSTTSTLNIYDTTNTSVSQRVDTFSTELIARMQGGQILYDQTFTVAFTDPSVTAAIGTARGVLTGNGASSFIGPTLLTNNTSLVNSVTQTGAPVTTGTDTSVATTTYIGPQTIMVGDNQSLPFTIPAGGVDYDTLVTSFIHQLITATTTDTFLTGVVYELDGVAPTSQVPEPSSLLLLATGGMSTALFYWGRKRRK